MTARWLAVEPREGLSRCLCVRLRDGRLYARSGCLTCNGAGVLSVLPVATVRAEVV